MRTLSGFRALGMACLILLIFAVSYVSGSWGRNVHHGNSPGSSWGRGEVRANFTPLLIPECVLWLEAGWGVFKDTGGTLPSIEDSVVALWRDRSISDYNAAQGTNALRPIFKADVQNGRSAVRFDGIDDHLITPRMEGEFTDGFTWFIVTAADDGQPPTHQSLFGSLDTSPSSNAYFYAFLRSGTNGLWCSVCENTVEKRQNVKILNDGPTDFFITTLVADPAGSLSGYLNRSGVTPESLTGLTWSNIAGAYTEEIALGGRMKDGVFESNYRYDGDIAELIIYGRALNEMERWRVESYLSRKYSITLLAAWDIQSECWYLLAVGGGNYHAR